MQLDKTTLYDWNGANEWLFRQINQLHGDTYDAAMIFLSRIADHHNFPYIIGILLAWALLSYIVRKLQKHGGTAYALTSWLAVFAVLGVGYAADGLMIKTLKEHFAYPRPYIALPHEDVRLLEQRNDPADGYHSFPSGHASFATLVVAGMWPVLSTGLCVLGTLLIVGVCWSRIALGMHFPADVLGGFLLTLLLVILIRAILYRLLRQVLKIKC